MDNESVEEKLQRINASLEALKRVNEASTRLDDFTSQHKEHMAHLQSSIADINTNFVPTTEIRRVFTHDDLLNRPQKAKRDNSVGHNLIYTTNGSRHDPIPVDPTLSSYVCEKPTNVTWFSRLWQSIKTGLDRFFSPCKECNSKFSYDLCTICNKRICHWCQSRRGCCVSCERTLGFLPSRGDSVIASSRIIPNGFGSYISPSMLMDAINTGVLTHDEIKRQKMYPTVFEYEALQIAEEPTSGVVEDENGMGMIYGSDK